MTEEIIIERGCIHCSLCDEDEECYHKQLKRLEQDSKQLTQWLDEARRNADFWCDKCTSLEQENRELKKQIESQKGLITVGGKQQYDMTIAYDKCKSALEEIREKAQHCIKQDVCALCDYSKECAVPDADGLVYDNNRLLIKLINEVLND